MATKHITVEGDTFDGLALEYYDDEKQASAIIAYNLDYCNTVIFDSGVELQIPDMQEAPPPETLPPWRRSQ